MAFYRGGLNFVAAILLGLASSVVVDCRSTAAPIQWFSSRDTSIAFPAGGNGDSMDPTVSADGRFVVFSSGAGDLIPGQDRQFNLNVFVHNRISNTMELVSGNLAGTGGGNSHSLFSQVSTGGGRVLFESQADDLVEGDANATSDVLIKDLASGTNQLVSVAAGGGSGNLRSSDAVMTSDGRYVAFVSQATNLVAGDTNGIQDVFVRDLLSGVTSLVSTGAVRNVSLGISGADMSSPVITPDGRFVAFASTATGLAGTNVPMGSEVYVRDLVTGATAQASEGALAVAIAVFGTSSNYASYHPRMSDDGRFVAFKTVATSNSVYTNAVVLLSDLVAETLTVIDANALGMGPADPDRFGPEITPDGRYIAYVHQEPDTNSVYSSVHVWDAQSATDILVSTGGTGVPPGTVSDTPVITPDGRFVAFLSDATNLVANPVIAGFHIYLRDIQSLTTQLVDADTNGVGSTDMAGGVPSLSADGRFVAFAVPDGGLVSLDNNGYIDSFLRDVSGGTTILLSRRDPSLVPATGHGLTRLTLSALSANGRWLVFESVASGMATNDSNGLSDVFADDLVTGQRALISEGMDGNAAQSGPSTHAMISVDGRHVVFLSAATNIVTGPTNVFLNVYRRDLQTGVTILVTPGTNGLGADRDCLNPLISANGRYVAFESQARNLVAGGLTSVATYWCDMDLGQTKQLVGNAVLSMSSDGRYVCLDNPSGSLRCVVRDAQMNLNVYSNAALSGLLSPDGSRLLFGPTNPTPVIRVADVLARTNLFTFPSRTARFNPGQWSDDSRFLAFVSSSNHFTFMDDGINRIYLQDFASNVVTLVSVNFAHTGAANGPSDMPMVSGDGRFVVYRSEATDLVPYSWTPGPRLFVYDRLTAVNSLLSSSGSDSGLLPWLSLPLLSSGGESVAFQSTSDGLVIGDLNRTIDAFTTGLDSDADGVPDWWMLGYFGHAEGRIDDSSRAFDDADTDGRSNMDEYLDGTNPRSATADFALRIAPYDSSGSIAVLMWPANSEVSYTVQYRDDWMELDWSDLPDTFITIANRAYYSVPADQPGRFYRVVEGN